MRTNNREQRSERCSRKQRPVFGTEICARAVNREQKMPHQKIDRGWGPEDLIILFLEVAATAELKISIYYLFILCVRCYKIWFIIVLQYFYHLVRKERLSHDADLVTTDDARRRLSSVLAIYSLRNANLERELMVKRDLYWNQQKIFRAGSKVDSLWRNHWGCNCYKEKGECSSQ